MTYVININKIADEEYAINVVISDDTGVILKGNTDVCVASENLAKEYAETVFLPDLRANYKRIAGLVLDGEVAVNDAIPEPE